MEERQRGRVRDRAEANERMGTCRRKYPVRMPCGKDGNIELNHPYFVLEHKMQTDPIGKLSETQKSSETEHKLQKYMRTARSTMAHRSSRRFIIVMQQKPRVVRSTACLCRSKMVAYSI